MPPGFWLQFRYDLKWIAPSITTRLKSEDLRESLRSAETLIAYLDQSNASVPPEVVPCRMAKLIEPVPLGSTVSIQLELGAFARAEDVAVFNRDIRAKVSGLPEWKAGQIEGFYWFEIPEISGCVLTSDLESWESLVSQLAPRPDFSTEMVFYTIEGMLKVGSQKRVDATSNKYKLGPNQQYELRIYHFHPTQGEPKTQLSLETTSELITLTTNPEVSLESRYDLKRVRLRTRGSPARESAVLTMKRRPTSSSNWEWEFDLPVSIRGWFWRKFGLGALLGAFLAVSPIVAAYSNSKLSPHSQLVISIVSAVSSLLAGEVATFGLRRTL
jgi:hypothetical protein